MSGNRGAPPQDDPHRSPRRVAAGRPAVAAFVLLALAAPAWTGRAEAQPGGQPPYRRPAVEGPRPGRPPGPPPGERLPPPPWIPGVAVVELGDRLGEADLDGKIYVLEDPTAELTFADVSGPRFADRFRLAGPSELNFGFSRSAIWVRLDVDVRFRTPPDWMLVFSYPLLDRIEFYDASSPTGEPRHVTGDRLPFATRPVPHRSFAFPLGRRGPMRAYVRITSTSSLQVRARLVDGATMLVEANRREFLYGLAYGVFVLMAFYNLFLFVGVRDWAYLAYVFQMICGGIFLMALNGHAFEYLWPNSPALANFVSPLFAGLWLLASASFGRLFLEPRRHAPRTIPALNAMVGLGILASLVSIFADYRTAMEFASASAAVNGTVLLVCAIFIWRRGNRSARFFTVAWAGLGLGVTSLGLSRFGLLPDSGLTLNSAMVGGVFEAVLLSLALSDRFRIVNLELESYSRELEEKVADRTRELEAANKELELQNRRDGLTGVANRRSFDEALEEEIKRSRRNRQPLSLLLLDVDHFKEYNDRHGHQAGDQALRGIARAMAEVCQRASDLAARYGGEEFAAVLADTGGDSARGMAEAIRAAVAELGLTGNGGGTAPLTVSVGVATAAAGDREQLESLVARADRALYRAKGDGRNRVCTAGPL